MSRMPSTSTGTVSVIPASSAARSTSMRNGLGSGGSTSGSCANAASGTGSRGRSTSWPTRPIRSSSSSDSTARRRSLTGSVTMACASSPSTSSAKSRSDAPSFTRRRTPGARSRRSATSAGHQPPARGTDHSEARVPGVETLQQCDVGAHRFELALDAPRAVEHEQTELGRLGTAPAAHEQRHAELGLELAHLVGHVRLHRRQRVGGGGERALLGDGEQRLEVTELHGGPSRGAVIGQADGYHRV